MPRLTKIAATYRRHKASGQASRLIGRIIAWYSHERLHWALGDLRPVEYDGGNLEQLHEARRPELSRARH